MQSVERPIHASPGMQAAWEDYLGVIDEARALMLNSSWAGEPIAAGQAQYAIQMLQAFGFNVYMGPRQRYPHFYTHTIFMPFEYGFGAPCPDFYYRWTFLDGRKTYRIRGKMGTTQWVEMQGQRGFWGDPDQKNLGTWDFDDFKKAPDGSFEIIASAKRHEGNWMQLDPEAHNITVMLREAWYNWETETGIEIHIEILDPDAHEAVAHSEDEIIRRLRAIGRITHFSASFFLKMIDFGLEQSGGYNRFWSEEFGSTKHIGGNPRAFYPKMVYKLEPGMAVIVESEIPNVRFWSVQAADPWFQTVDYAYHQSSLNGHQARVDLDGKARMVLSLEDPGVPNWIDPVDNKIGLLQWRWYLADRHPIPETKVVALKDLRAHLPADTPAVTPADRKKIIGARTAAVRRRFGI